MRRNVRKTKKLNSRGFTLVEMMVTLAVMGILLAITFVGLNAWIRNSEFKKCNEYAHTIYTAASLELSSRELASDLERFTAQVQNNGTCLQDSAALGNNAPEDIFDLGRMYAITAKAGEYDQYCAGTLASTQANLVYDLIDNYSYDKEVCDYTITIEYDTETQSVYAVYISSWAKEFVYSDDHSGDYKAYDEKGVVSLNATGDFVQNRSYEVRKALMVGYYCVEELGIKAAFNEGTLHATKCYLDNGETLDLVTTSNSQHTESDVKYIATIYQKTAGGEQKLFDVTYSWLDLEAHKHLMTEIGEEGQPPASDDRVSLKVTKYEGDAEIQTQMYFPLNYENRELRLTLDAVMSANAEKACGINDTSASFRRFLKNTTDLPDIYALVRVEQLTEADLPAWYDTEEKSVRLWIENEEYITGASVKSNTENTFFKAVKNDRIELATTRHLSNIRYVTQSQPTTFQLVENIQFEDAVIYDLREGGGSLMTLMSQKAFPAIPSFQPQWILTGKRTLSKWDYAICGLSLTEQSVITGSDTRLGMILDNRGTIEDLEIDAAKVLYGYREELVDGVSTFQREEMAPVGLIRMAGVICGFNDGTIQSISLDENTSMHVALDYRTVSWDTINKNDLSELIRNLYGIGLVCGVHHGQTNMKDIRTAGQLEGYFKDQVDTSINTPEKLPGITNDTAIQHRYRFAGIGGVCGMVIGRHTYDNAQVLTAIGESDGNSIVGDIDFLNLTDSTSVRNTAMITGNMMVGGITGNIRFLEQSAQTVSTEEHPIDPIIVNCANEGIIHLSGTSFNMELCGDETADQKLKDRAQDISYQMQADHCFAGGIVGFLHKGVLKDCTSAAGVADESFLAMVKDATADPVTQETKAHAYLQEYLTGNFVGGITGCVVNGELKDCYTKSGGYVLGNDQVGGIVGYMAKIDGETRNRLTFESTREIHNGCSVIGHSNVGGIVGSNQAGNTIEDCINEGVVVGSGRNIGGIVGKNQGSQGGENQQAIIRNCTSEVFDYDGSTYRLVSEVWQMYGDNVGGIVGFNEYGQVGYQKESEEDDTRINISAIVVGNNNVGGVFGMAGVGTEFDFEHYTVDGGEVYAKSDCAGGYIGVNLTDSALPASDAPKYEIRPYSVKGRYGVGGVIGANILCVDNGRDVVFDNKNALGTVYGAGAVGGIVGYQRNVSVQQSGEQFQKVYRWIADEFPAKGLDGTFARIVSPVEAQPDLSTIWISDQSSYTDSNGQIMDFGSAKQTNIFGCQNDATVIAGSFGGGILGYGCSTDKIVVKNCENYGDLSDWEASGVTGSTLRNASVAISELYKEVIGTKEQLTQNELEQILASKTVSGGAIASLVGGITGYVTHQTTIQKCNQHGMIYAKNGFGGIAGINLGTIDDCQVLTNLGTQSSNLIGGIAAINGSTGNVTECRVGSTEDDYTIEGHTIVGGFFGLNVSETMNADCSRMYANISGSLDGEIIGGMAGINAGKLVYSDTEQGLGHGKKTALYITGGKKTGGVAGIMTKNLYVMQNQVVSSNVQVTGEDCVGGLFGELRDGMVIIQVGSNIYENAGVVTANNGYAGGIVGKLTSGTLENACNLAKVTAYGENGYAGGIVAYVEPDTTVQTCKNEADVTSINSCAGGICAWNKGVLKDNDYRGKNQTIHSNDENMGIIAAYNEGTIQGCEVTGETGDTIAVTLQGNGKNIGGIVGSNSGRIMSCAVKTNYIISTASDEELTIGGAVGKNEGAFVLTGVTVSDFDITLEGNCAYFGGLVGQSTGSGIVSHCQVENLRVEEKNASLRGSCYGGAIGSNAATASAITVKKIDAKISGLYQANVTLEAEKQENLANCFGGIVGKNDSHGVIEQCSLDTSDGYSKNQIVVANGLVGGITGINKGLLQTSGYKAKSDEDSAVKIAESVQEVIAGYEEDYYNLTDAQKKTVDFRTESRKKGFEALENNSAVQNMITTRNKTAVPYLNKKLWEKKAFSIGETVAEWMESKQKPTMLLKLTGNGSIGGIAAYNTSTATMQYCISGHWLIDNRSPSQYSAQGGIIGTNESNQDTCYLVNQAMVLRESAVGVTERVNGGIIGNQHNTTNDQWTIYGCINTGMVVNFNSHYSGGIIGRWSDQGGSVEYCRNYGIMQTSYQLGWKGAAGGIVAQLYHPLDHQSYTILSCRNDGSILGVGNDGTDWSKAANEAGGIMGNVIIYQADQKAKAQPLQLNFIDCVNGPDATIICYSMGGGILGYMNSDRANQDTISLAHLELNFDRCRNYCTSYDMKKDRGFSGIFGDRDSGHELTRITNCFTLAIQSKVDYYGKKGYICNNNGSSSGKGYLYDGGKSAICYNNRVLLVDNDGKVDPSVMMNLDKTQPRTVSEDGICFAVLNDSTQKVTGELSKMLKGEEDFTVSGNSHGAIVYIQLKEPMKLGELEVRFAGEDRKHSCRVEYLTESTTGASISNNFTLAKEVIAATGETETISLPTNVPIYALRLQYVQDGVVSKADSGFLQYGYYISNASNTFTLSGLTLKTADGESLALSAYESNLVSPRLVDGSLKNADHFRNASTQYLYVATQGEETYLIEPQFEDAAKRLSASAGNRKSYNKTGAVYQIDRNELFDINGRPYGMIYANIKADTGVNTSEKIDCQALDDLIVENYKTALAAAMPIEEGSLLPETPSEVKLDLHTEDAGITVSWDHSIDGARNVVKYYLLTVKDNEGKEYISEKKCIGNEWKLSITDDMVGKKIRASVCAVNENGTSQICESEESSPIPEPMLMPQIRLELIRLGNDYKYEVSLENKDAYQTAYGDQWQVDVYRQGDDQQQTKVGSITTASPTFTVAGEKITDVTPSLASWQLCAQARYTGTEEPDKFMSSLKYSTSVYTPTTSTGALPGINQLYAAFDENYESELDAKLNVYIASAESKIGIYPVYQIDLIRVDTSGKSHILASKEMAVSNQLSNVTFTDLPSEFFDTGKTKYFYVRAWLSQTGVGPVYTWHETDQLEISKGSLLVNTQPDEEKYVNSTVLTDKFGNNRVIETSKPSNSKDATKASNPSGEANAAYANTYMYAVEHAPKLESVTASYESGDHLTYTLRWSDQSDFPTKYELQVYGKKGTSKMLLQTVNDIQKEKNQTEYKLTVDDWTYSDLEIVIIQKGTGMTPKEESSDSRQGKTVPRAYAGEIQIRNRLPKLSQPTVKLISQNDLKYQVSWQDVSNRVQSDQTLQYALYLKKGDEIRLMNKTDQTSIVCDLEKYANQTVRLYVVAYLEEDDLEIKPGEKLEITAAQERYFKSKIGLKKKLVVGKRLNKPELKAPQYEWNYRNHAINVDKNVLAESQFASNSLKLDAYLKENNNYIMNGIWFETVEEAEDFIDQLKAETDPYTRYGLIEAALNDPSIVCLSGSGKPIMMSQKDREKSIYSIAPSFTDVTLAGGYLIPLIRSTAATEISSYWTLGDSGYIRIPRVQLDTPNLNREMLEKNYAEFGESLKNAVAEAGTPLTNVKVQYEAYRFYVPSYVGTNILTLTTKDGQKFTIEVQGDQVIVHTKEDPYTKKYTLKESEECLLDVIRNPVKGTYRSTKTSRAYYRMTFDTSIRREIALDGTVSYVLRLPQTKYAITCDGGVMINGSSQLISDVFIQAIPNDNDRYESSKAPNDEE